jgi:molybdopterin-containing oxidoreductase family membrane subunit
MQLACNVIIPQLLWFRRIRNNRIVLFVISLIILIGMWLERYVLITTNLSRDYLPSKFGVYSPTVWDWATFLGTVGLFFAMMFLFLRLLPSIATFEMRELVTRKGGPNAEPQTPRAGAPERRPAATGGGE